jgi:DNA-binding transcriptional regulator YhcF (GntR family)
MPEMNDPRPAYLQVADYLRASITARTFKPGERLPSGWELARHYRLEWGRRRWILSH